jgi:hypothetical protein
MHLSFAPLRLTALLLSAGLLAACTAAPPRGAGTTAPASSQRDASATGPGKLGTLAGTAGVAGPLLSESRASREIQLPAIVVIRRYDDVFRENEATVPVTVEYAWDYARGVGIERVYTRDGKPHSQRDLPEQTMNFTDTEMELAFALAREHERLGPVLAQTGLRFYGGFAYREATDPGCGERSRCVHVIVSGGDDGERPVAHAIVDLMKRVVVHPFFGPDNPGPLTQAHP